MSGGAGLPVLRLLFSIMNRGKSLGKYPQRDIGNLVERRKLIIIIKGGFISHSSF
jgi:hypothetical protein